MNLLARLKRSKWTKLNGDLPDFAGKTLVIYVNSERIGGGMFQDARVIQVGFNVFVVGRRVGIEPPFQQRWARATVWTSVNNIAQILVFDDFESAKRVFDPDGTEAKSDSV